MKEEQAHTEQGGAAEEDEEEEERGWTRSQWLATTSSPPPAPLPRSRSQPGGIGRGHRRQPFGGRGGWGWIEEQRLAPAQGEHTAKTPEARRTPETLRRKRGAANGNANAAQQATPLPGARIDEGRLSFCTATFVPYRDSPYKRERAWLNGNAALVLARVPAGGAGRAVRAPAPAGGDG